MGWVPGDCTVCRSSCSMSAKKFAAQLCAAANQQTFYLLVDLLLICCRFVCFFLWFVSSFTHLFADTDPIGWCHVKTGKFRNSSKLDLRLSPWSLVLSVPSIFELQLLAQAPKVDWWPQKYGSAWLKALVRKRIPPVCYPLRNDWRCLSVYMVCQQLQRGMIVHALASILSVPDDVGLTSTSSFGTVCRLPSAVERMSSHSGLGKVWT